MISPVPYGFYAVENVDSANGTLYHKAAIAFTRLFFISFCQYFTVVVVH